MRIYSILFYLFHFRELHLAFLSKIEENNLFMSIENGCLLGQVREQLTEPFFADFWIVIGFSFYFTRELFENIFSLQFHIVALEWEGKQGHIRIREKSENSRIILIGDRRKGCPIKLSWDRPSESETTSLVSIEVERSDNLRISFNFLAHHRYPVIFFAEVISISLYDFIKIPWSFEIDRSRPNLIEENRFIVPTESSKHIGTTIAEQISESRPVCPELRSPSSPIVERHPHEIDVFISRIIILKSFASRYHPFSRGTEYHLSSDIPIGRREILIVNREDEQNIGGIESCLSGEVIDAFPGSLEIIRIP